MVIENLIFTGHWNGPLTVLDGQGELVFCECRIRAYAREGENLLWLVLTPQETAGEEGDGGSGEPGQPTPEVVAAFAAATDVRSLLRVLLANQPGAGLADAVMLPGNIAEAWEIQKKLGLHPDNPGGFSALVEVEGLDGVVHKYLLDSGWSFEWMDQAFKREKIDQMLAAREIEGLFLSHEHWDHFWGFPVTMRAALQGEPQLFERTLSKPDGSLRYSQVRYIPDRLDGEVRGFFVLAADVTELKITQKALEQRVHELDILATTDPLTGLANRRFFINKATEELTRSRRYKQPLAMVAKPTLGKRIRKTRWKRFASIRFSSRRTVKRNPRGWGAGRSPTRPIMPIVSAGASSMVTPSSVTLTT